MPCICGVHCSVQICRSYTKVSQSNDYLQGVCMLSWASEGFFPGGAKSGEIWFLPHEIEKNNLFLLIISKSPLAPPSDAHVCYSRWLFWLSTNWLNSCRNSKSLARTLLRETQRTDVWNSSDWYSNPISSHSNEEIRKFMALALTQLTMWIQSFLISDNSFGKTLIIKVSLRPVATGWCRRWGWRGCKCTPKSLDVVKIRAKSLKIRTKSTEIWEKSVKTLAKSLKMWANYLKNLAKVANNVLWFKKMAPNVCRIT